jgi:hypothetical protein
MCFFSQETKWKFKEETIKVYNWNVALNNAEIWTLWKADQKHLESFYV